MPASKDLIIRRGATFSQILRWEALPIRYLPITGITQAAPARVTSVAHGLPQGWRVAVVSVLGMTEINAENVPPKDKEYHAVSPIDVNTVELNTVNAAGYTAYASGGYLQCYSATNLTGYTARMSIKDKLDGTELLRLTTGNGRIILDNTVKTILLTISSEDTEDLTFAKGVFDLELVTGSVPNEVVTSLLAGSITVVKDVTTT